jgi:hypothetical protein
MFASQRHAAGRTRPGQAPLPPLLGRLNLSTNQPPASGDPAGEVAIRTDNRQPTARLVERALRYPCGRRPGETELDWAGSPVAKRIYEQMVGETELLGGERFSSHRKPGSPRRATDPDHESPLEDRARP